MVSFPLDIMLAWSIVACVYYTGYIDILNHGLFEIAKIIEIAAIVAVILPLRLIIKTR